MITRYCRRLARRPFSRSRSLLFPQAPLSPVNTALSLARARARAPCHSRLSELDKHSHLSIYIITLDHVTLQPLFSVSSHYCLSSLSPHTTASLHCLLTLLPLFTVSTTAAPASCLPTPPPPPPSPPSLPSRRCRLARTGRDHRLRKQAFFLLLI